MREMDERINDILDHIERALSCGKDDAMEISEAAGEVILKHARGEIALALEYIEEVDENGSVIICFSYYDENGDRHAIFASLKVTSPDDMDPTMSLYTVDEYIYPAIGRRC